MGGWTEEPAPGGAEQPCGLELPRRHHAAGRTVDQHLVENRAAVS